MSEPKDATGPTMSVRPGTDDLKMADDDFIVGDKVFAKARGHTPWPAVIRVIYDDIPGKLRYKVYFYGRDETAICKYEELHNYVDHRELFLSMNYSREEYVDGMRDLETDLPDYERCPYLFDNPEQLSLRFDKPTDSEENRTDAVSFDSDDEGRLIIDENPPAKTRGIDDVVKSQLRRASSTAAGSDPSENKMIEEIISRSGRKIKLRKFADHDDMNESQSVILPPKILPVDQKASLSKGKRPDEEEGEEDYDPHTVREDVRLRTAGERVSKVAGSVDPVRKTVLENLILETSLLDCVYRIQCCLGEDRGRVNLEACLVILDDVLSLRLNPLMLKKNPIVLETIACTRAYVGEPFKWALTSKELREFKQMAHKLRKKADLVYRKLKALFGFIPGVSFQDMYDEEMRIFQEATSGKPESDVLSMTEGPTFTLRELSLPTGS